MFGDFKNYVAAAISRLGGPTKAAHQSKLSNATIHVWIKRRRVPDLDKAQLLATLSGVEVTKLRSTL